MQHDGPLYISQSDVKDYFYRLGLRALILHFCLLDVSLDEFHILLGFIPEEACALGRSLVTSGIVVAPLGFSWAFWLAQKAHDNIAQICLPHIPPIYDHVPVHKITGTQMARNTYADNGAILGCDRDAVIEAQRILNDKLLSLGLDFHVFFEGEDVTDLLGHRIDGEACVLQPTPHRLWRLHQALRFVELWHKVTPKAVESSWGTVCLSACCAGRCYRFFTTCTVLPGWTVSSQSDRGRAFEGRLDGPGPCCLLRVLILA